MRKIGKGFRMLFLASSIWFGAGAGVDTYQDTYTDIKAMTEQTTGKPVQNDNDNDGMEGAAKGAIALASLCLFLYSGDKASEKTPILIEVDLPLQINTNFGNAEISHILDKYEPTFLKLLKEKIPDYLREVCDIEKIEFTVHNGRVEISVHVRIAKVSDTEDIVKLVIKAIKKYIEDLFQEKFDRVQREMIETGNFEIALENVLERQLQEARDKRAKY